MLHGVIFLMNVMNYSHHNIWRDAGVPIKTFRYYHPESKGLDFSGLLEDIKVYGSDSYHFPDALY